MAPRKSAAKKAFDWDAYKGSGTGVFLSSDETQALIDNEIAFKITGVSLDEDNKFGARYVIAALVPNPLTGEEEERKRGFAIGSGVDSRDDQLEGMSEYFEAGGDALEVVLVKGGNAILIEPAGAQS